MSTYTEYTVRWLPDERVLCGACGFDLLHIRMCLIIRGTNAQRSRIRRHSLCAYFFVWLFISLAAQFNCETLRCSINEAKKKQTTRANIKLRIYIFGGAPNKSLPFNVDDMQQGNNYCIISSQLKLKLNLKYTIISILRRSLLRFNATLKSIHSVHFCFCFVVCFCFYSFRFWPVFRFFDFFSFVTLIKFGGSIQRNWSNNDWTERMRVRSGEKSPLLFWQHLHNDWTKFMATINKT